MKEGGEKKQTNLCTGCCIRLKCCIILMVSISIEKLERHDLYLSMKFVTRHGLTPKDFKQI